ncbi:FHA domain-containing protein FHA2 [Carex littledalei]|uniref:FHA domain-containing protein FHA2 n=1 Tax=Carex littledalei TaxID=544730 RepID=A0A833VCU2_9POAL|nr:FHA domain-containing protein FHA2 [Carex littledalei]
MVKIRGGAQETVGFAKLQGEDFEYYMQTYSIVIGRSSKKLGGEVDVDLSGIGGGMNISRRHARIFYDFSRRRFALEVLGKNGCYVEGVLHVPGSQPVKLDSKDLLQIGDLQFYFLLPTRSIFDPRLIPRLGTSSHVTEEEEDDEEEETEDEEGEQEDEEEGVGDEEMEPVFMRKRPRLVPTDASGGVGTSGKAGPSGLLVKKGVDREADNRQLLLLEEKDVISSVATVLSDLCGPGEWMPMLQLHEEMYEKYGLVWHHSRVRKYLTSEDYTESETKGKPWYGLLTLLRKYPEHFVINTRTKGRITTEFVSLVSLLS